MDFKGKRVIVTGASTGIGRDLAISLAGRGARVALAARSGDMLFELGTRCADAGGEALVVTTDVTDPEACRALVEKTADRFGGIDCVVNNAGLALRARFEDITDLTLFERIMQVNYLGAVYVTHFALPHIKKSQGLFVAISSITGVVGVPTRTAYAASKHAMQGFFDSLRIELYGTGVDVLVVSPGFVMTGIRERALGADGNPLGKSPQNERPGDMPVAECVRQIVAAMEARQRDLVMLPRSRLTLALRALAPNLIDKRVARAISNRDSEG
jgi:NAD(P)-dependent dehydrogenase (short-subunit alcohol dehydrogenase family)